MSRSDRFDRGDYEARYVEQSVRNAKETPALARHIQRLLWPIANAQLQRVGDSVLADRNGQGRPHKGIDLFAPAGTSVLAACGGRVLRAIDGRTSPSSAQRRAGLFVDVEDESGLIFRYLHLGTAQVRSGDSVLPGALLGTVASSFTSGLAEAPHLHFEIRQGDFDRGKKDYGKPVDPRRMLPPLRT